MNRWLIKSDPAEYSAQDLCQDAHTIWSGVRNATAQMHIRAMRAGDELMVYHTGKEKAVVAIATVQRGPFPDPTDASGKLHAVEIAFKNWLNVAVPLTAIKSEPALAAFDLVRISRLSVLPVAAPHWKRIVQLAGGQKT